MRLFKALYAFYQELVGQPCEHPRVQVGQSGNYCPDCGYKIQMLWAILRCRTCGSKRLPKKHLDGKITPLERYCKHCGATDYQLIQRKKLHVHELTYAVALKEVDYLSEEDTTPIRPAAPNPFRHVGVSFDVVDGEVLRKQTTLQPKMPF